MPFDQSRNARGVREFINRLLSHATNAYSVCSLFLAGLALLPIWFGLDLRWLSLGAVVFSLIPASYRTWQEALETPPALEPLVVTCTTSVVNLPIETRVPRSRGRLDIRLDISNPNDVALFLTGVEVLDWQAPSAVFAGPFDAKLYGQRERSGFGELRCPVEFAPQSRRDDIALFVGIQALTDNEAAFARSLAQAEVVSLAFEIHSEDARRHKYSRHVTDEVPLEVYKRQAFRVWEKNRHSDLLAAAGQPS